MKGKNKSMTELRSIIQRLRNSQSKRRISKELSVHRSIIRKLYDLAVIHQWLDPTTSMPSDEDIAKVWNPKVDANHHPLKPYHDLIEKWHIEKISSVVILQLLKDRCRCSIQVIRRYRSKHFPKVIEPVMVRTTAPGRDMDIDFGELGKFYDEKNQAVKKVYLLSLRLRHSRKTYRELVFNQTISTFLMGHVHAFEYFGGIPLNCIMDNLKAAVIKSTIDNEKVTRSYQDMAEHYGFMICPCLPYTPSHKGGVESDVNYVKSNFLAFFRTSQKELNITVSSVSDLQEALNKWDAEVADVRLVYGVDRSPLEMFNSEEKNALLPLPKERWELTSWQSCTVRKEWRVMIENAYYSVPYILIEKRVDACITNRFVRIFYESKEVAMHEKATEKWEYKRKAEHAPPFKEAVLQCTRDGLLCMAKEIGPYTHDIVSNILACAHLNKLRPVRCILKLKEKYTSERLENACKRALKCKMYTYRNINNILENNLDLQELSSSSTVKNETLNQYRFERDFEVYNNLHKDCRSETFVEKLERLYPFSKHGNAIGGVMEAILTDQLIDEELAGKHLKERFEE